MIYPFNPARHANFWSTVCFETNGGGGGGGGGGGSDSDSGSNNATFQGPTPGGSAGYTQDLNKITVDRNTGFVTSNTNRDRDRDPTPPPAPAPAPAPTRGPDDGSRAPAPAPPAPAPAPAPTRGPDDGSRAPAPGPISNTGIFQGPTPGGGAGYTQDPSIGSDPDTGFLTDSGGGGGGSAPAPVAPPPPAAPPPRPDIINRNDPLAPFVDVTQIDPFSAPQLAVPPARPGIDSLFPTATPPFQRPDTGNRSDLLAPASPPASPPGQTGQSDTFQKLYGYDPLELSSEEIRFENLGESPQELADFLLATGNSDAVRQLMQARPELFLPPNNQQTVMASGQVPAGTPGARAPRDVFMNDEVQTLIKASPEARQVYQTLDLTPFVEDTGIGVAFGGGPTYSGAVTRYRDPQGNVYSAAEAFNYIRSGGSQPVTLPGGYSAIAPFDATAAPAVPALDLGLRPVDVATPIRLVGGGGGGGSAGGGAGRGDPRDFGFVAEEAAASRGSRAGIEGLLDRSPTAGQPAATSVPQASDIILGEADSAPGGTRESPPRLVPPSPDSVPEVDLTITRPDTVGGGTEADEDVEVTVDTGGSDRLGQEEETGTTPDEDAGVPGGTDGDEGAGEGVEVDIGAGEGEGAGTGGEGTGEGTGTGTGTGAGEGTGTGTGTGSGDGTGTGTGTGEGTGTGTGGGDGTGESAEEDVEVVVDGALSDEEEEELLLEEEEPAFECPEGFRKVQMANGSFTCVPDMVRPRVGPYTQTVDVSPLAGRTPFRPGARRT